MAYIDMYMALQLETCVLFGIGVAGVVVRLRLTVRP